MRTARNDYAAVSGFQGEKPALRRQRRRYRPPRRWVTMLPGIGQTHPNPKEIRWLKVLFPSLN
jgi:hypothetical protein